MVFKPENNVSCNVLFKKFDGTNYTENIFCHEIINGIAITEILLQTLARPKNSEQPELTTKLKIHLAHAYFITNFGNL